MSGIGSAFKQFLFPFSTLAENRKEPFTLDLEAAAVFSLAELDRGKGGGIISRRPEETIAFVAKVGYPLWLFPWFETALIFDGFNRSSYILHYAVIPDINAFIENLKRSSKTRETHTAFLSDHINYFQAPVTEKSVVVNGLIREPEFLNEFESYRHEAMEIEDDPANVGLITPTLEEFTVAAILK